MRRRSLKCQGTKIQRIFFFYKKRLLDPEITRSSSLIFLLMNNIGFYPMFTFFFTEDRLFYAKMIDLRIVLRT